MPSPNKSKGNAFERVAAAHLSKVFGAPFMRVPTSGAYTGKSNAHRADKMDDMQRRLMTGDIIPPQQVGPLKIECKSYKSFAWHAVMDGGNKQLDSWISQAYDTLVPWLLLFKINNQGTFVVWQPSHLPLNVGTDRSVLTYGKYRIAKLEGLLEINAQLIVERAQAVSRNANLPDNSNSGSGLTTEIRTNY